VAEWLNAAVSKTV